MKKNNHITAPDNCTGCALCSNVCSKEAIRMVWSEEGFLVPSVDVDKCVECGACVKNCPAQEENIAKLQYTDDVNSVEAYGAWNQNEAVQESSSSGGVFTALAEQVIESGGCVFGVVWRDKLTAVFSRAETVEQLASMRGAKYTHANADGVYREVRAELLSGRRVLFSGTPCQVHALRKYLRKDYENLLTIDIVCHGIPSHLILEKYIELWEQKAGKDIRQISFRDKPEGWSKYHVTRHYVDGSSSSTEHHIDVYMKSFLCDRALNKACYSCPYAHIPRQGDITLGDYWGVAHYHPDWPLGKGISAVLAGSVRGKTALQDVDRKLRLHPEPFAKIYAGQRVCYVHPVKNVPESRALLLKKIKEWTFDELFEKIINIRQIGPLRIRSDGKINKMLNLAIRVFAALERRVKRLILGKNSWN